ncbi:UvrD-helicase domain-containing protein [Saccharothrix variisporea]|uniref:DNA 3'-5' helicase n=1 Tax=Saccharothrix variisporea TaxID=543527 RepID=A0A495XG82_9PSEU|nr:UvrD-helicase domain-containing protein [Saccharothrix variisporea]RKT73471.1 UvrD-like helicase family protein [Saccharothrix variisporea]
MGLSAHAWRQVQRQAGELVSRAWPGADPVWRRVLTALVAQTADGWRVLARRDTARRDRADVFLVGVNGVTAVAVGGLDDGTHAVRHAEEACAGIRGAQGEVLAGSAIHYAVVAGDAPDPFARLTEADVPRLFRRDNAHLTRAQVKAIAAHLERRLKGYKDLSVQAAGRASDAPGLLEVADVAEDQLAAARQRPFESWLTFLHPHQQAVVTRRYNGPARISGPAGTGKTVVALHRLRHLARRTTGPLLFTTFVRTLPRVHRSTFARFAPELVDRVEFTNLHSWARDLLDARGKPFPVDARAAHTQFNRAWTVHRDALAELEPNPAYWHTEIDRVIKGRGLETFEEYAAVVRKGRRVRLDVGQKRKVWQLYETYQRFLRERGAHDHNDLVAAALHEVREERPRYAAVVVDEVQDITLTGLRLLRELAGDVPDGLLLVGDGQQQVYTGGWRLSDAGIPVQGRGEVLRVNYRNRERVLAFARDFDADNAVDDLDGAAGVTLREAEVASPGGQTKRWSGTGAELPEALAKAVRELPVPLGQAAVITFSNTAAHTCARLLREAGIEVCALEDFDGGSDHRLKVGTVHRAKGLDFQGVLVVEVSRGEVPAEQAELLARQRLVAATRARDHLWWGEVRE